MISAYKKFLCFCLFVLPAFIAVAQPSWTIDPFGKEKKPKEYEEKKLPSERTGEKKMKGVRKFVQNNTTRYNYYFNANNKLNLVLERAKMGNVEDYSEMLNFFPYTLEATAAQQTEIDSVIIKATNGILLHDLRTNWVDDMYFLIGKAYYFRKEFDSARLTFQFINYNLFPREKDEDYNRVVGTVRESKELGSISISNKEDRNIFQRALTLAPIRNESLIWLARNFVEMDMFGEAAGILNILKDDKNFPERLKNDLHVVTAYWYYRQNNLDSTAAYLAKGLGAAADAQERGRWEYLLGQLYEKTGMYDKASEYYALAAKHTVDPVLEIFANLQDAKMLKNKGDDAELGNVIARLTKMAGRDKYDGYEDIIYYSLAQLSLQRPDTLGSLAFYNATIKNLNEKRPAYRNKSFYEMATLSFNREDYINAYDYYDSLDLRDIKLRNDSSIIETRKDVLGRLVTHIQTVNREDSLQRIAAMPAAEREAFMRKLIKDNRKLRGLKDTFDFAGNTLITFNNQQGPIDLFEAPAKGDWYFYNRNIRSKGFNDFNRLWGKRQNRDNWRTNTAAESVRSNNNMGSPDTSPADVEAQNKAEELKNKVGPRVDVYDYAAMEANLPISPEMLDSSNASIAASLLKEGEIFRDELQNYPAALKAYQEYLRRFETHADPAEAYFGLYRTYQKLGDNVLAEQYKNMVITKHASTVYAAMINNPESFDASKPDPAITAKYQGIYNNFLRGKYDEAIAEKAAADSIYGKNYWTPQLLYIEGMHYARIRQDSNAIRSLNNIINLYPDHELAARATTLKDVLSRRAQIEGYLDSTDIVRADDDVAIITSGTTRSIEGTQKAPEVKQPGQPSLVTGNVPKLPDANAVPDKFKAGDFLLEPSVQHKVIMLFSKIDFVYLREAKIAMQRFVSANYAGKLTITDDKLDADRSMLVFNDFEDAVAALNFVEEARRASKSQLSWLQADKYAFYLISQKNLDTLKTNKNLQQYRELLNKNFDNKF